MLEQVVRVLLFTPTYGCCEALSHHHADDGIAVNFGAGEGLCEGVTLVWDGSWTNFGE